MIELNVKVIISEEKYKELLVNLKCNRQRSKMISNHEGHEDKNRIHNFMVSS